MNLSEFSKKLDDTYYGYASDYKLIQVIRDSAKATYPEADDVEVSITEDNTIQVNFLFVNPEDHAWFLLKWA